MLVGPGLHLDKKPNSHGPSQTHLQSLSPFAKRSFLEEEAGTFVAEFAEIQICSSLYNTSDLSKRAGWLAGFFFNFSAIRELRFQVMFYFFSIDCSYLEQADFCMFNEKWLFEGWII